MAHPVPYLVLPKNMYKAVIFDFDGVLFDSVGIKTEAFRNLMSPYGCEVADRSVAYHLENGGLSRYHKLRHFHEEYVGETVTEEFINIRADQFAALVLAGVIEAPWIPGAKESLDALHGTMPLFICSGTPENELREIVQQKNIEHYFEGVFGSPKEKPALLNFIGSSLSLTSAEMVFVGDAMTDYNAAAQTSVPFVGYGKETFVDLKVTAINDMNELAACVVQGESTAP